MQKVIVINEQGLKRVWTDCRPESRADGLMAGSSAGLTCALAEGESLSLVLFVLPDASDAVIDLPVQVTMGGPDSRFELHALALASETQRVNIRVDVEHPHPDAHSNQLIRCVAGGESRIAFEGLIKVQPGAVRTAAFQTSNNLLLSEQAKVRTCPQLEIYADDVKCSHGATTGSLDEDEQFYMRSRGITLEQARLLQLRSFIWPVLAQIEEEDLRASCDGQVSRALEKMFPTL
ncbi:MAG: SufD family Fe-S cluster assembly protein [Bacteroidales bacterium]|nr:SufD family Fe-S cluster assembly protein [Bacteroidales bacterium]